MMETAKDSFISYYNSMSTTTTAIILGTSILLFVKWLTNKTSKLPPGPFALPILGNLLSLRNKAMGDVINEWKEKYGPIFTFYLGPTRVVAFTDIGLITEALVKQGSTFSGRPFLYSLSHISEGSKNISFSSYSGLWKFQRKVAVQSLRQYLTGGQLEIRVHEVVQNAIQNMENEKGPIDIQNHIYSSVFNVLHGICFGSTLDIDDPVLIKMKQFFDKIREEFRKGFFEDLFPPLRLWPTKRFSQTVAEIKVFNQYNFEQMDGHRENFNRDEINCLADNIIQTEILLQAGDQAIGQSFTKTHAAMICSDVFGAGNDTSSVTLNWIFLVLTKRPEIQARIQREIDAVIGQSIPGKEHRLDLIYTEAFILEVLRMFPPTPFGLLHETMCDTNLGGYQIPRKTTIMACLLDLFRNPAYWDDPFSFKPERFLDETQSKIVTHKHFIPFSLGQRSCPGESLAKTQIIYIMAALLQKYTFSLAPGYEDTELSTSIHGFVNETPFYKVIITQR